MSDDMNRIPEEPPKDTEIPENGGQEQTTAFFDYSQERSQSEQDGGEIRVPHGMGGGNPQTMPGKNLALASLICAIAAFSCCGTLLGFPVFIAAIITAALSRKQAGYWQGSAIAGLVLGILGIVFCVLSVILVVFLYAVLDEFEEDPYFYEGTLSYIRAVVNYTA